mmetsp:Transcript_3313/g.7794  ORF Transcript_3313/g.7794 Transcript_3313/m.7794 type:complete len:135 (-) Transcript_3313:189-593(-)
MNFQNVTRNTARLLQVPSRRFANQVWRAASSRAKADKETIPIFENNAGVIESNSLFVATEHAEPAEARPAPSFSEIADKPEVVCSHSASWVMLPSETPLLAQRSNTPMPNVISNPKVLEGNGMRVFLVNPANTP